MKTKRVRTRKVKPPGGGKFIAECVLATLLGMAMIAGGIALVITIWFAPIGMGLIVTAGQPLAHVVKGRIRSNLEWERRARGLGASENNDGLEPVPPWMKERTRDRAQREPTD